MVTKKEAEADVQWALDNLHDTAYEASQRSGQNPREATRFLIKAAMDCGRALEAVEFGKYARAGNVAMTSRRESNAARKRLGLAPLEY